MPQIRGTLKTLTSDTSRVKEVWVQARFVSAHGKNVIVPETRIIPVENGEVAFSAEENTPGTIVLVYEGSTPNTPIPIYVGENPSETLGAVINAARLEKNVSEDAIKKLISEALTAVGDAREDADKALKSAQKASQSASESATSAGEAKDSATKAKSSQDEAAKSATDAQSEKDAAAKSAKEAKSSEDEAAKSATAAKTSQDEASKSATNSKSSKDAAAKSAKEANTSATNAKTSENKSHEYMEKAQGYAEDANRGIPDGSIKEKTLSPELATKVNAGLTHVIGDISGLQAELDKKASKSHTHDASDINGVSGTTTTVNNYKQTNKMLITDSSGKAFSGLPTSSTQITNKQYVDNALRLRVAVYSCTVNKDSANPQVPPVATSVSQLSGSDFTSTGSDSGLKWVNITSPGVYRIEAMASSNILDGSSNCEAYILLEYDNSGYTSKNLFAYANPMYSGTLYDTYRTGAATIIQKMDKAKVYVGVKKYKAICDVFLTITKLS